jgi:F0F1-type ATP synthase membrane subunit b/b'
VDRPARRLIAATFAAALVVGALGGCSDQNLQEQLAQTRETLATTQQDLQQCQANIKDDFAGRQLAIDTLARNAAIAQACQWGVDICPSSWEHVPSPTVQFEVHGKVYPVAPNGWIVFGLVTAKLAAMAAFLIVLLLGMIWMIGPSAKALKEAERVIEEAKTRAAQAEARVAQARREQERLEEEIAARKIAEQARQNQVAQDLQEAQESLEALRIEIDEAQAQLNTKRNAAAALGAFHKNR